jgi:hypothetical protein
MAETPPIACTLSSSELNDREGARKKLLGSGLVERDLVPGGIRLRAATGAATALIDLIDLERAHEQSRFSAWAVARPLQSATGCASNLFPGGWRTQ